MPKGGKKGATEEEGDGQQAFDAETTLSPSESRTKSKDKKKGKKEKEKKEKKPKKEKKGKNGRESVREVEFGSEFVNPAAEDGDNSPPGGSLSPSTFEVDEGSPAAGQANGKDIGGVVIPPLTVDVENSDAGSGGDPLSPRSPRDDWDESPQFDAENVKQFEEDAEAEKGKRLGRAGISYFIMTTGTLLLLPIYTVFAVFMLWVFYIVPNPMSFLGTCVAVAVPGILYVGRQGAKTSEEGTLQMFSFLMVLGITLQVSIMFVVALDDGTLVDAFLDLCAEGARTMCANMAHLPWGAELLPTEMICACAAEEADSSGSGTEARDLATCLKDHLQEDYSVGAYEAVLALCATLGVEITLSWIAWGMMVDLDLKETRDASRRKGGGPTGTLRGKIVCGTGLLCEFDTLAEKAQAKQIKKEAKAAKKALKAQKKKTKGKKGNEQKADEGLGGLGLQVASRRVELALKTPGLDKAVAQHINQVARSPAVEDDCDPEYSYEFFAMRTYAASTTIVLSAWDFASDPKGKQGVCVGTAKIEVKKDKLPEYGYTMDADPDDALVKIPLTWTNPKTGVTRDAGKVLIELVWVPEGDMLTNAVSMITKTWYFELTVIGMVGLAMMVLAYQSPSGKFTSNQENLRSH